MRIASNSLNDLFTRLTSPGFILFAIILIGIVWVLSHFIKKDDD